MIIINPTPITYYLLLQRRDPYDISMILKLCMSGIENLMEILNE